MASICMIGTRWRAQVKSAGLKSTARTFDTEAEAREWAAAEKRRRDLVRRKVMLDPMLAPTAYRVAGVYILFRGAEVRYVGRSSHIYRRLNDHDRKAMDWDGFRVWPCSDSIKAADMERRFIEQHRPPLNEQCKPA